MSWRTLDWKTKLFLFFLCLAPFLPALIGDGGIVSILRDIARRHAEVPYIVTYGLNEGLFLPLLILGLLGIGFRLVSVSEKHHRLGQWLGIGGFLGLVGLLLMVQNPLSRAYIDWLDGRTGYVRCGEYSNYARRGMNADMFIVARAGQGCKAVSEYRGAIDRTTIHDALDALNAKANAPHFTTTKPPGYEYVKPPGATQ